MTDLSISKEQERGHAPATADFIALIAAIMATSAFAIDAMLPALPAIGASLDVAEDNRRQLVVTTYLIGLGVPQLFYGPLSDRVGRKPILATCLFFYAACSLLAGLAASFTLLLAARFLQGVAGAGMRVLAVSIVRDRFEGDQMARVMSIAFLIFMIVPVIAPAIGQAVLVFGGWRVIFLVLAGYGLLVLGWAAARLPETLAPDRRRSLSAAALGEALTAILANPVSIGNTIVLTLVMGALFGFINSIQQIVFDVFGRPEYVALVFACIAGPMAATAFLNSRLVVRIGALRLMFVGLAGFVTFATTHLLIAAAFGETLVLFILLQATVMAFFTLISANVSSIAMKPLGHVAGTAASIQGVVGTVGGALIGLLIGQHFNGTALPLLTGYAVTGVLALLIALWANRNPPR